MMGDFRPNRRHCYQKYNISHFENASFIFSLGSLSCKNSHGHSFKSCDNLPKLNFVINYRYKGSRMKRSQIVTRESRVKKTII